MRIEERIDDFLMRSQRQIDEDTISLLSLGMFADQNPLFLNEAEGMFSNLIKKIGFHASSGQGIIQMVGKGTKLVGQLMWYAMKAATGDEEAKKKVKEIGNTQITKEEILDFVLRLDAVSLHLLTGPIHMIDALLGWHIWANVKSKVEDAETRINNAIKNIESIIANASGTIKSTLIGIVVKLKKLISGDVKGTV